MANLAADGGIVNAGGRMFAAPPHAGVPATESLSRGIRRAMRWADPDAGDYMPIEI